MAATISFADQSNSQAASKQKKTKPKRTFFKYAHSFKSNKLESYYQKVTLSYVQLVLRNCLVLFCIYDCFIYTILTMIHYESTVFMISQCVVTCLLMLSISLILNVKMFSTVVLISLTCFLGMIMQSMTSVYTFGLQMEICYTPILQIVLIIFTILPWDLFVSLPIALLSVMFSLVVTSIRINTDKICNKRNDSNTLRKVLHSRHWYLTDFNPQDYAVFQVMLWITVFIQGLYMFMSNRIWRRLSFLNLGQHLYAKQKSESAMKGQLRWIDAIMPTVVREEYWTNFEDARVGKWCYVKEFDQVTILFADIVGFTKMSSNKSALHIVKLLNDLFNRFDNLSIRKNCEKLGTLGDCYYCVAGCPTPRHDHAFCCVEMGIGMCKIIKRFNKYHKESINMRVGIHSGKVNAAIIGKCRIHFDVYSNDAIIANAVETSGKPGKVHITESVHQLVSYSYAIEPGEMLTIKREENQALSGMFLAEVSIKTFFIDPENYQATMEFDNQLIDLKLQMATSISKTGEYDDISFGDSENVDVAIIHDSKKDSSDVEEVFSKTIKDDDNTEQFASLEIPVNFITLMFNDPEIEWHYYNHVFDQVQHVELHSIKLSPCVEAFLSMLCLFVLMFGSLYVFAVKDSSIIYCSGLVLGLKMELVIIELWKASTYHCLIKQRFLQAIYYVLCNEVVKAVICVLTMILPNMFVLLFFHCFNNTNEYYYQARFFSMSIFAMFIGAFNGESILPVKVFSLCINYVMVLYTVVIAHCHDDSEIKKPLYPRNTCLGYNNTVTEAIFISNNRYLYFLEITLTFIILIFIVRERDMSQRRWFYLTREAQIFHEEALRQMYVERDFLFNIIPKYVFKYIKSSNPANKQFLTINYAVNVKKAAVVFACISNFFAKYYREDYKSGTKALHLLNQIITQMDGLLELSRYKDVEKIKTINDCYMLASGLNVEETQKNHDPKFHLKALLKFSFDMLKLLADFNEKFIIGSNNFEMKIGYNVGSVTAGIIGIKKPMYDIWGDTVNVASRMYSTGHPGDIQVPHYVRDELKDKFVFVFRGSIFVKGKGQMRTFICKK